MKGQLAADVKRVLDEAKTLLAAAKPTEAMNVYSKAFDAFTARGDHFSASNVAHMAGVAEPTPGGKLIWNERALHEADAVEDRESVAGFYASLYNNLAFSHALLGDRDEARRCIREAWIHVGAIEPGQYADQVRAAIQKRLAQFEDENGTPVTRVDEGLPPRSSARRSRGSASWRDRPHPCVGTRT